MRLLTAAALVTLAIPAVGIPANAGDPSFHLTIKDHRFIPPEVTIPANIRVIFHVKNLDPTTAEFESDDFKAEKIVPAGVEVTVAIPPLKPGVYEFHDEFNEALSKSRIIAK